jgi:hypothetical protein
MFVPPWSGIDLSTLLDQKADYTFFSVYYAQEIIAGENIPFRFILDIFSSFHEANRIFSMKFWGKCCK